MTEILLCSQPMKADTLSSTCGIDRSSIHGNNCTNPDFLSPFTPYAIGDELTQFDNRVVSQLSTPQVSRDLTNLSLSFGGDNTLAIAEITKTLQDYNVGVIGASTSVYANRIGGFAGAVKKYQDALLAYREAAKSNAPSKMLAKDKALKAFQELQVKFRHELNAINAGVKAKRGTPLSSATRATNIAQSSRNASKLNVTSQIQANNLVRFTRHAKFLGNGLAVIDFSSRVGRIHNSYRFGGNWERDLFIESSSFVASAVTGSIAVSAGSTALSLLMVATPIGWVGLIVGGLAVAGTAAAASMAMNSAVQNNSGDWYDSIMSALDIL